MAGYSWNEIEDLPDNWQGLVADELTGLADIWQEQRKKLSGSKALSRFSVQLQRQWAIETGIIEGLYTLDRGVTQQLIEHGLEASLIPHGTTDVPASAVLPMIRDHEHVIEGLFDFVGQKRVLSTSYIKEVHQALTLHQESVDGMDQFGNRQKTPLLRGAWKTRPNNPSRPDGSIHEYCPPEHVTSEMDRLIAMHLGHQAAKVPPEVEAAWLHHRFTQIHPFQDGNGRVARALATLILLRAGWFPLVVVSDEHRDEYIKSLEKADHGDLTDLVVLFARLQKHAFLRALSISEDVVSTSDFANLDAVLASVSARLQNRVAEEREEMKNVFGISSRLEERCVQYLQNVGGQIERQIKGIDNSYSVLIAKGTVEQQHWFWNQVVLIANQLHYYADLRSYHAWARLIIRKHKERQTEIVVSFHSLGTEFLGVLAATAFIQHRVPTEEGTTLDGPYPVCSEAFQFSYNQDSNPVEERFNKWLNDAMVSGLDQWRRQL